MITYPIDKKEEKLKKNSPEGLQVSKKRVPLQMTKRIDRLN